MRAVVQRVKSAAVRVDDVMVGSIGAGLLVLLGIGAEDTTADADYLVEKVVHLRVFADEQGKMNRSLLDVGGQMLVISQFTLYGDCRRGRRPSYSSAAPPEQGKALYEYFIAQTRTHGAPVESGVFQAIMDVELINAGPVTILLDSQKTF